MNVIPIMYDADYIVCHNFKMFTCKLLFKLRERKLLILGHGVKPKSTFAFNL